MRFWLGFLLAYVAGFVDTATFVGARGLFSAHVTGNFVLFAVALTQGVREIDYLKLFVFVPFLFSVAFTSWLNRRDLKGHFEPFVLFLAAIFLFIPALYFHGVGRLPDELWDMSNVFILMTVVAMGLQNGLYKILSPTDPMTTVMTGNVIQIVIEVMNRKGAAADRALHITKAYGLLRVILGFGLGCLSGAWLVAEFKLVVLLVPGVLLGGLGIYRWKVGRGVKVSQA